MTSSGASGGLFDLGQIIAALDRFYPRLLTQIDRDPDSPTYGSCDRHFWMYRLNDFDSGVLQQASLSLAALAALSETDALDRCRYLKSTYHPYWRLLAKAVNRRTVRLLGLRGFLDEYYPGERSFPGTVFSCYAALKSAIMLEQREVIESPGLEAAARMLLRRKPSAAANQDAAGAAFLALYASTRNWRRKEALSTVERLIAGADGACRFQEYGGLDLGYATVTLNYLAHLHDDGTFPTLDALSRLAALVAEFVTAAGHLGGEFASRGTTYFLPFGLIVASFEDPDTAGRLAPLDLNGVYDKLDDRYLMHYCLPSLAMAALRLARDGTPQLGRPEVPAAWRGKRYESAGLYACRKGDASVFVALNKGGSIQAEADGWRFVDCGYRVLRDGTVFATCVIDESPNGLVTEGTGSVEIRVESGFHTYPPLVAGPLKTVVLRLMRFLGPALNAYFKSRLITRPRTLRGLRLERHIIIDFAGGTMTIEDAVAGLEQSDRLTLAPPSSLRLVPSAKLFQHGEEDSYLTSPGWSEPVPAQSRRTIRLEPPTPND